MIQPVKAVTTIRCFPHPSIRAYSTTRDGGFSAPPYHHCNLSETVGDNPKAVQHNRRALQQALAMPSIPIWLKQIHSCTVHHISAPPQQTLIGDGCITALSDQILAICTADCLPILLADEHAHQVAAIHAGWRGLHQGIIRGAIGQFQAKAASIYAWLGPAISAEHYVVEPPLFKLFCAQDPTLAHAFKAIGKKYQMDLNAIATHQLQQLGIQHITLSNVCTYGDPDRYYSYRREGPHTGRIASFIWKSSALETI